MKWEITAKANCHQEAKLALQTSQDPGVMIKGFDWAFLVAQWLKTGLSLQGA